MFAQAADLPGEYHAHGSVRAGTVVCASSGPINDHEIRLIPSDFIRVLDGAASNQLDFIAMEYLSRPLEAERELLGIKRLRRMGCFSHGLPSTSAAKASPGGPL